MPFSGQITDYSQVGDIASLGTTVLTEMAQAFEQFPGDPIAQFFPMRNTMDPSVAIERVRQGVGIAPLVEMGQPDTMTDSALVDRRVVQPAHTRESDFVPQHVINNLRQVGTMNEKVGREFITDRVQRMTNRSNHFFAILRAMALLGGINYTDPRTGVTLNVNMQIPAGNLRDLTGLGATRTWDALATATAIRDLTIFRQKLYAVAKTKPTHVVMRSDLKTLLDLNADIIARVEGSGALNATGFVEYRMGELYAIAGMQVITCDTLYDDPVTNTRKYVWPVHKVALVASRHEQASGEFVGRQDMCVGEDPMGRPGLWMRSGPDTSPPAPPGRSIQMGNTGLPYLRYPDWVGIMTVGVEATVQAKIDTVT